MPKATKTNGVRVIVRTKPTSRFPQNLVKLNDDKKSISIANLKSESGKEKGVSNLKETYHFTLDRIINNGTQEEVYSETAENIIDSLFEGINGCLMCYGQTGAGKTFTMTGVTENYKHRGLIPRSISHIFRTIRSLPDKQIVAKISYCEIYLETIYDLLDRQHSDLNGNLKIVEDGDGNVHVMGLTTRVATNEEEALNVLFAGDSVRTIADHNINRKSSRSHCIFTVYLDIRSRVESTERVITAKLNMVDLAGSERLKKSLTTGPQMQEAMFINKSLSFLEQVIVALGQSSKKSTSVQKAPQHIPFRQTKLTTIIKDSLGGNCRMCLIANIWLEALHIEETMSTLRFATRMMQVQSRPEINIQYDPDMIIRKYEREIKDLRAELAMHDQLANRSHIRYEPYTEEQRLQLQDQIHQYVNGQREDLEIQSLNHMREICMIFKNHVRELEATADSSARHHPALKHYPKQPGSSGLMKSVGDPSGGTLSLDLEAEDGVGDVEGGGFAVGLAPMTMMEQMSAQKQRRQQKSLKKMTASSSLTNDEEDVLLRPDSPTKEGKSMPEKDMKEIAGEKDDKKKKKESGVIGSSKPGSSSGGRKRRERGGKRDAAQAQAQATQAAGKNEDTSTPSSGPGHEFDDEDPTEDIEYDGVAPPPQNEDTSHQQTRMLHSNSSNPCHWVPSLLDIYQTPNSSFGTSVFSSVIFLQVSIAPNEILMRKVNILRESAIFAVLVQTLIPPMRSFLKKSSILPRN